MSQIDRSDVVLPDRNPPALECLSFVRTQPDDREILVLTHIAAGFTDDEISRVLGTSIGRVRWAARSVMAKLGAVNRPHAVARAISMGFMGVGARGPVRTEDQDP